eukprot:TRINITY_DN4975_c0_g1_i2.p1 TRINITY_DN4975_c0_g1~~TRINITY_DN4975_c0_g1_i2.p1  ORF type:complete len:1353 (-),score=468.49 TRINITY_DN4975_c0_g1_i2:426-4484(-)
MSRRKQAKPIRHFEDEDGTPIPGHTHNNDNIGSSEERPSFNSECQGSEVSSAGEEETSGGELSGESGTTLFLKGNEDFSHNNNNNINDSLNDPHEEEIVEKDSSETVKRRVSEQLKSIGATIASLTANAAHHNNPKSMQELAVLQATLFSLQQQQLLQMQILSQMQQQLQISSKEAVPSIAELAEKHGVKNSFLEGLAKKGNAKEQEPEEGAEKERKSIRRIAPQPTPVAPSLAPPSRSASPASTPLPPSRPLEPSPSLASSIIMHTEEDEGQPPVNSLELLQQRAQGILNNASQGLLANNLADFGVGKDRESAEKKGEPFFKHRCRYCGKVFGSDSALQIHVRSHTGERPYKCNVCGNRFTTKGNLKVHFQRHSSKFPLVKMNPNLVPEQLDKFYPPLLQQIEESEKKGLPPPPMNDPMAGMRPFVPPGVRRPSLPGMAPPPPPPSGRNPLFSPFSLPSEPMPHQARKDEHPAPLTFQLPPLSSPVFPPTPEKSKSKEDSEEEEADMSELPSTKLDDIELVQPDQDEAIEDEELEEQAGAMSEGESELPAEPKTPIIKEEDPIDHVISHNQEEPENLSKNEDLPVRQRSPSPFDEDVEGEEVPMLDSDEENEELQCSKSSGHDPAKDPNVYANLLPRPGSNDNAWESLIEVARPSETAKLEALVNNIENKLSDPNECAICHRVLSCKSALQMHYRTHTGERPFKCRICGRAFTTKGNLKTHMGVHRAKPPLRMFHQCPVCHKKYANALVLQQHIRTHTGEPTELTSEQIAAAEIRDFPSGLSPLLRQSGLFPPFSGSDYGPISPDELDDEEDDLQSNSDEKMEEDKRPSSVSSSNSSNPQLPPVTSTSSFPTTDSLSKLTERPFGLIRPFFLDRPPLPEDLSPIRKPSEEEKSPHSPPKYSPPQPLSPKSNKTSRTSSPKASSAALDLTANPPGNLLHPGFPGLLSSPGGGFPGSLLGGHSPVGPSPLGFNPLRLPFPGVVPGLRLDNSFDFLARGNTTCQICFKVFACNSALEIHIRSHTKERPFKCDHCDRGFSTKGNMKQHALTHKTRDSSGSDGGRSSNNSSKDYSTPLSSNVRAEGNSTTSGSSCNNSDEEPKQELGIRAFAKEDEISVQHQHQQHHHHHSIPAAIASGGLKRSPGDSENNIPSAKRSFGGSDRSSSDEPRHTSSESQRNYCQLCKKNFSSCSALQIHMRTHTGDRPFKCHVCGKAFTTKGNLKVHMGIHMWSNTQASRRGRRMSLDLPRPPIPMTAKDSEFLQRRPELFYPYLQSSFAGHESLLSGPFRGPNLPLPESSPSPDAFPSGTPLPPSIRLGPSKPPGTSATEVPKKDWPSWPNEANKTESNFHESIAA